ncbi:hypothetical protein HYH03_011690 [Edaphochlamys debaryana]|uniref:Uncharacterized protein n=1 Tax=Edaphochlamys debaryana TaxID=47281 RepID=A0A835XTC2_9CHLO|nr:hypothetical protein HYH03_011690 [Edaphochlamys debaryana]|eukprot:KAG2489888.1 hypothetical protein HYH03_011690 [Edaphochlamys debaryana]
MPPRRRPLKSLKPRGAAGSIENDWKGLLEIGGRLLRLRGSGPKLSVAEADSLQQRLQRLFDWVVERECADDEESVAKALSGQRALALLRLQAWAARLHPDPRDMGEGSMIQSVATTAGILLPRMLKAAHAWRSREIAPASGAVTPTAGFSGALLRTQALRAAAVELSHWLQKLEAGARTHLRSGPQRPSRNTSLATAQLALDSIHSSSVMQTAMDIVDALCYVASTSSSDSSGCSHQGSAAGPSQQPAQQPAPLYQELISELEATAVMEHAAKLLLQQGRVAELLEAGAAGGGAAAGAAGAGGLDLGDPGMAVRCLSTCAPNFLHAYSKLPDALELVTYEFATDAESASASVAEAEATAAAASSGGGSGGGADEGTAAGRERGSRRGGDEDGDWGPVMAVARTLQRVLQGPAVQFAVLSYGIRTLCAADGGSSYGVAAAELSCVRPLSSAPEGDGGRRSVIDTHLLAALLTALSTSHTSRSPPITARAAAALALRLGRIALATARGFGSLAPPSEPSPDNPALVLPARRWSNALSTVMAMCAGLQEEISSLEAPEGAQPRLFRRPGWAAEAEASWRLWVDVLRWAVPRGMARADVECVVRQGLRMQGEALEELWQHEDASAFPAEAPPELAAALRAGWLPALEVVLVHTCTEDEPGPYSAVLMNLSAEQPEGFACQTRAMLSYGELSQCTNVVAALGAVLRRLQRDLDLEYGSSSGGSSSSGSPPDRHRPNPCLELFSAELCPGGDARQAALFLASALLVASPSAEEVARAPPPVRRCSLLMSLAALEWLPPLSRMARQAVLRGGPLGSGSSVLDHVIPALALWVTALAEEGAQPAVPAAVASAAAPGPAPGPGLAAAPDHIHASGSGTHGGDSEDPAASGGGAAATAAAASGSGSGLSEWQRFVVEEVGAVHVVGAALALVEHWVESGGAGAGSSRDGREGGRRSSDGSAAETGSVSAMDSKGAAAGSTASGLESGSSGKAACGEGDAAGEVGAEEVQLTVIPVAAACLALARLLPARRLLGAAHADRGPSLPWRPEALRVLRRALEAECAREYEEGPECADEHEEGPARAGSQEDGAPSSNLREDGAICGAALEQLAACLEAASSGAGGSGGAPEVEGLGVGAEVLEAAEQAVNRLMGGRLGLPAVQPLAEARALRPHSAAGAGAAGSNASASASLAGGGAAAAPRR